jgi:hypothetical protein
MKMTPKLTTAVIGALLLSACGGGGGGSDKPSEPTRAAGMYMSAINNPVNLTVKRVAGGNRMALKAAKIETKAGEEEGTDIDPMVGLYATDEGGKEFRIHFELTDDKGVTTGYDEKVEPKSAIQLTPDTVYLELWVKTNTNNAVETRQYLVQFTTGKMIEVQRLALGDSYLNEAYKYVLPANSLHNGTQYPIVLLKDKTWYQLDADWNSLTYAKEPISTYVFDDDKQGPAGNLLVTADKQVYQVEGIMGSGTSWYVTHNNEVVYHGIAGLWLDEQGRIVLSNYDGLYYVVTKDGKEVLEQFSVYDYELNQAQVVTDIVAKNGELLLGTECRVNRDNAGVLETLSTSSMDTDAYYAAGAKTMVCVDKPDEDFDYFDLNAYCGQTHVWNMYSLSVDGTTRREVKLNALPYQVTQVTEDTAYALLRECVQNTDGSWSLNFQSSVINFADNSVTPVSSIISLSAFIH